MNQKLYSSFDVSEIHDELLAGWDHEDKPNEDSLWNMAYEYSRDDYQYIVDTFEMNAPDVKYILVGHLGLWNGRPFAYKLVDKYKAFNCDYDDLTISYEDGDIWVKQHHHDGTNVLKLLGIKDLHMDDFLTDEEHQELLNELGVTEEEFDEIEGFYYYLKEGFPIEKKDAEKYLPKFTFSVAPYLKDFLSDDSLKDLEGRNVELEREYAERS